MPKPTATEFESRVARLLNRQGAYVRRRVDIDRWVHPARVQITDLDVLAIDFDVELKATKTIAECKTGEAKSAPSELDRMLWLVGLRRLASADHAMLATLKPASPKVREVGNELGVAVQDLGDIERRERLLGIDKDPAWGAHDPTFDAADKQVRDAVKSNKDLTRVYWFLRSEFWHAPPGRGLKRAVTAIRTLGEHWTSNGERAQRRAVAWLMGDSIVAFTLAAIQLAADAITMPAAEFRNSVITRLSEGITNIGEMSRLSKAVDEYVAGLLSTAGLPQTAIVAALGAFDPAPPDYTQQLLEVLERLAERPLLTRCLPVFLDVAVAQRIRHRQWSMPSVQLWQISDPEGTAAMGRMVLVFLKSQAGLPPAFAGLLDDRPQATAGAHDDASHDETIKPNQLELDTVSADGVTADGAASDTPEMLPPNERQV